MYTKAQLIEKGRHYFDNKEVNKMFATPDGNFFYENSRNYADSHAKSKKDPEFQVIEITRMDLNKEEPKAKAKKEPTEKEEGKKEEPKAEKDDELAELRKEAKELKIKGSHLMGLEKLKAKIAEAKE